MTRRTFFLWLAATASCAQIRTPQRSRPQTVAALGVESTAQFWLIHYWDGYAYRFGHLRSEIDLTMPWCESGKLAEIDHDWGGPVYAEASRPWQNWQERRAWFVARYGPQ